MISFSRSFKGLKPKLFKTTGTSKRLNNFDIFRGNPNASSRTEQVLIEHKRGY